MSIMISLSFGIAIASILLSLPALIVAGLALSYVVGLRNSTHQIQYVPLNDGLEDKEVKKEYENTFSTSFDDDSSVHI